MRFTHPHCKANSDTTMKAAHIRNLSQAALLILAAGVLSTAAQQIQSLVIVGRSGSADVIQRDGHNYVDVQGLASITQSSIRFNGNQIVLAMPGTIANAPAPAAPGFSKDFAAAGIELMSEIREWRAALKNAIEHNYLLNEAWHSAARAEAQQALGMASIAISNNSDKNAFTFLTNEFTTMNALSEKYLKMSESRTYINPASFGSDPLNQKITTCAHSLASMAAANQFIDDGSCR
jgi:hypothetical protein